MGFGDYVTKAVEVVKLNTSAMKSLAKDSKAFTMGVAILAIAGVATGIGMLNPVIMILGPIAIILLSFVCVGIIHLLALLFGGKGSYTELYNVLSHSAVMNWVMIIPFLGMLLGILVNLWRIVIIVVALETVHGLSRGNAILVVLIPVIAVAILVIIAFTFMFALLGSFFGGAMLGAMMGR